MVNCGYQGVIVKNRNSIDDSDLMKFLRKTLEKLVIFDNLTPYNTKTLEIDHQDKSRLNKSSIFDAFFKEIT